jgi:hypothetical protein
MALPSISTPCSSWTPCSVSIWATTTGASAFECLTSNQHRADIVVGTCSCSLRSLRALRSCWCFPWCTCCARGGKDKRQWDRDRPACRISPGHGYYLVCGATLTVLAFVTTNLFWASDRGCKSMIHNDIVVPNASMPTTARQPCHPHHPILARTVPLLPKWPKSPSTPSSPRRSRRPAWPPGSES